MSRFFDTRKMKRIIPMLPVGSLDVAISFYEKLGFTVEQRRDDWGWAMLACGGRRLMLDRSINVQPRAPRQSVIYLYAEDLVAFHRDARAAGLVLPEIEETFYGMKEFRIDDPDGNRLWIGQNREDPPIRRIGDTVIQPVHRASCHCGGVVLELQLPDGIVDARRCNCSMCRRKGAIMGAVPLSGLRVVQGEELLSVYRFNSRTAEHFFCSRCGIYTHHRRRSNSDQYGFNVGCLEGVDPNLVTEVPVRDGVNHPADYLS